MKNRNANKPVKSMEELLRTSELVKMEVAKRGCIKIIVHIAVKKSPAPHLIKKWGATSVWYSNQRQSGNEKIQTLQFFLRMNLFDFAKRYFPEKCTERNSFSLVEGGIVQEYREVVHGGEVVFWDTEDVNEATDKTSMCLSSSMCGISYQNAKAIGRVTLNSNRTLLSDYGFEEDDD